MPIYEYKCNLCGSPLEVLQKITEDALIDCPTCHQPGLQKLVSAAGFQLKGTGWYATDFRDKGKQKPETEKKETPTSVESNKTKDDSSDDSSSSTTGSTT